MASSEASSTQFIAYLVCAYDSALAQPPEYPYHMDSVHQDVKNID